MSTKELLHHAVDDMTEDQASAIYSVIRFMLVGSTETKKTKALEAYETIEKLRKPFTTISDDDEKEAYHRYLEEKYENLG